MAEFSPDACTYDILNRARVVVGLIHGARELFDKMPREGIWPTATTFGKLVSALVMASRLDDAFRLTEQMLQLYNIKLNVHIMIADKGALQGRQARPRSWIEGANDFKPGDWP
ncbi:hypothetical protein KSP40_PGU001771 [Platanthera guangdongensis]|uniref:Pentatricopeptide repeat-containing protein n=1 Tax=Platanthera guangdongensis TaxID=2320717 RepID=A0ABR2MQE5_9ASPA